jgi:hypothetical protein
VGAFLNLGGAPVCGARAVPPCHRLLRCGRALPSAFPFANPTALVLLACLPAGDGKCPICDSFVRPAILVRVCDECNYGSYAGRCVVCGGIGVSDAYYCKECTIQEKDVSWAGGWAAAGLCSMLAAKGGAGSATSHLPCAALRP